MQRMRSSDAITGFSRKAPFIKIAAHSASSCALCIIQIDDAVNRLSGAFTAAHPEIDWRRIYGMGCHLVHGYEMLDAEIVWSAVEAGTPLRALRANGGSRTLGNTSLAVTAESGCVQFRSWGSARKPSRG